MATETQYTNTVWYRLSKGKPQPAAEVWRSGVQATLKTALQRLAEKVAGDEKLWPLLTTHYLLHLSNLAELDLATITIIPGERTLLLNEVAQTRWRLTVAVAVSPPAVLQLERVTYRYDLDNPPPIPDFWYYIVGPGDEIASGIVVRDYTGSIPEAGIVLHLWANGIAAIDDPVFDAYGVPGVGQGELFDDLCDIGAAIVMESSSLAEVVRQAEEPTATHPPMMLAG